MRFTDIFIFVSSGAMLWFRSDLLFWAKEKESSEELSFSHGYQDKKLAEMLDIRTLVSIILLELE
ncbi:MAG: hypothetical protein J6J63_05705 [Oscillospiraceae bacterium]|nr:hypothetical protein [Oscillospiraceae bacterium]